MVALFTKNRGNDTGNLIAMTSGFLVVAVLSNLLGLGDLVNRAMPADWQIPAVEFPWRIMFGTIVTAAIALCFATKDDERLGTPDEV